jgi:hypothetical protein
VAIAYQPFVFDNELLENGISGNLSRQRIELAANETCRDYGQECPGDADLGSDD